MKHLFLALMMMVVLSGLTAQASITGPGSDTDPSSEQTGGTGPASNDPSVQWRNYFYTHLGLLKTAIKVKIFQECETYSRLNERLQCWPAASKLVTILDIAPSYIHSQKVNVSFSHKLLALTQNADVQNVLKDFLRDSDDISTLHDAVQKMPNTVGWDAFIAILFQDRLQSHINYLRQTLPKEQQNLAELVWSADQKFYDLMLSPDQLAHVYAARPGTQALYHFFVIHYVTETLMQQGVPAHMAAVTTFLFNYVYKVQEYQSVLETAFKDPAQITNRGILADLFLGYQGAFFGQNKSMPQDQFSLQFATNTPLALSNICSK